MWRKFSNRVLETNAYPAESPLRGLVQFADRDGENPLDLETNLPLCTTETKNEDVKFYIGQQPNPCYPCNPCIKILFRK